MSANPVTAEKKVEDFLCYMANDTVLSTQHQREMSAKTLQIIAKLRADLVKARQLAIRQANEIRKLQREGV